VSENKKVVPIVDVGSLSLSQQRRVTAQVREQVETETVERIARWLEQYRALDSGLPRALRRGDWKR
jgi:hypothetical protein